MGAVFFYHLTEKPLEATLPALLERARANEWRIEVRSGSLDKARLIDRMLWGGAPENFLPHGISGSTQDDDQPILLTGAREQGAVPSEGEFDCVMCVEGAPLSASEVMALERACVIFDGADPEALQAARGQWKQLIADGCSAQYWAQEGGRWTMKAESKSEP